MELPNTVGLMILGQLMREHIQNHREQNAILEISYWGAHGRGGAIITVTRQSTGVIELMCPINDRFSSERKHRALSALRTWCAMKQLDPVADEKNLERWNRLSREAMMRG